MPDKKSEKEKLCRYRNCLHENRVLGQDEGVMCGNLYYHTDCLKTKEEIKEIIVLFTERINPNPIYAQLQRVIDNIVFNKGIGSEFLLFGLRYYIDNKIPLNYPQGLYYVIQNKNMSESYNKRKSTMMKSKIEIREEKKSTFVHIPIKHNDVSDIFK